MAALQLPGMELAIPRRSILPCTPETTCSTLSNYRIQVERFASAALIVCRVFTRDHALMITSSNAKKILDEADQLFSASAVAQSVKRMAEDITAALSGQYPLILTVMGGAVVFTGQLLPLLAFPLSFDYLHVSRYDNKIRGGGINWKIAPPDSVQDRVVLVLDDILDEGITLAAIRERIMRQGAAAFYSAVLAEKDIGHQKPIRADFVGLTLPNRYAFGFGMDVYGAWRNLPAIYALRDG
jgi:hypoxanthine phosphoribosyltransferase